MIHVFLSYSNKNKKLAHRLKKALEQFGVVPFLAHDDIRVSMPWRKEILKQLRTCNILIPIVTEAFTHSRWTDQEVGYAMGRKKLIVPVKTNIDPYGLMGGFQAVRLNQHSLEETCWKIMASLKDHASLADDAKSGAIKFFLRSPTFDDAWTNLTGLMKCGPFARLELAEIIRGSARNQNIYGCRKARPTIRILLDEARGKVPKSLIAEYRKAVQSWPW